MDRHVTDLDAERLFAGAGDAGPDEPLTRFTADLRARFVAPAAEPTRAAHLQAMAQTYAGLVVTQTPAPRASGRRRRFVIRGSIGAAAIVLVGGSAMAATGTLPDAAQDVVSSAARRIGLKLPRAHPAEIRILHPDVETSDIKIKTADNDAPAKDDDDDRRRRRVSSSDDDDDSDDTLSGTSTREPRRPRRDDNDGPTAVVDDGPSTPDDEPSDDEPADGGGITDDRGDPSNGDGDGGSTDPEPGDGDGSTDREPGDGDGDGGGRGDPKDGSASDADAGSNDPGDGTG